MGKSRHFIFHISYFTNVLKSTTSFQLAQFLVFSGLFTFSFHPFSLLPFTFSSNSLTSLLSTWCLLPFPTLQSQNIPPLLHHLLQPWNLSNSVFLQPTFRNHNNLPISSPWFFFPRLSTLFPRNTVLHVTSTSHSCQKILTINPSFPQSHHGSS